MTGQNQIITLVAIKVINRINMAEMLRRLCPVSDCCMLPQFLHHLLLLLHRPTMNSKKFELQN